MPIRLTTPRLLIEPFLPTDAPHLYAWASDPDTTRYMGWPRHQTLADSEAVIRYFLSVTESQPQKYDRPLVFRDKASGRPLGSGGIHQAGEGAVELPSGPLAARGGDVTGTSGRGRFAVEGGEGVVPVCDGGAALG